MEKGEFLKEAKLMWNFKHEHILSLIAICLDNDPNFLILELMEGGDLLSYLRTRRPSPVICPVAPVTLLDLVQVSAPKISIRRFVITEKAPTRAFSWLKAPTSAFIFKTLC